MKNYSKKTSRNKLLISTIMVGCLLSKPTFAANDDAELQELLELDLEELMVSVASKREEKISDAPAVISVITQDDIKRYGANNLIDVLRRAPGVNPFAMYVTRDNMMSIRGQHQNGGAADGNVLLLINGRPHRDSFSGGVHKLLYRSFPMEAVKHIEVVRGPGSVLYGTNAYSGVINIVTKNSGEEIEQTASIGYGSFGTKKAAYDVRGSHKDLSFHFSGNSDHREGWNYKATDLASNTSSEKYGSNDYSIYGNLGYKGFSLGMLESYSNDRVFGSAVSFPFSNFKIRQHFIDAGYQHDINDDWQADFNITHNAQTMFMTDNTFDLDATNTLYEATIKGNVTEKVHLLAGANYHHYDVEDRPNGLHSSLIHSTPEWQSFYVQSDYKPLHFLKITAGFQYLDAEASGQDIVPRLAAVVSFDNNWGAKLAYGEAFRAPSVNETFANVAGIVIGNPGISPQLVKTYDAQLNYRDSQLEAALSVFKSRQEATISLVPIGGGTLQYNNGGVIDYYGFELEGKYKLDQTWQLDGSVSYQFNESAGVDNVKLVSNLMLKTGISYDKNGIIFGAFNTWYSKPTRREEITPAAASLNPDPEAFSYLTLNLEIKPDIAFGMKELQGISFNLLADNVLENDVSYFADTLSTQINSLPQRPGRSVYGKVTVKF